MSLVQHARLDLRHQRAQGALTNRRVGIFEHRQQHLLGDLQGRSCHSSICVWARSRVLVELEDEGGFKRIPNNMPLEAEITLPLDADVQIDATCRRWRDDLGRAAGYLTLRE